MMDIKQSKSRDVAVYGGETNLHIEFDVPTDIIIKEKSPTGDPLNPRNTYGWKINYRGRYFGSYISIVDDIDDREDKVTQAILKEVYQLMMEQAQDAFIHRILMTETDIEDIFSELQERLDKKYYPVWAETDGKYCIRDDSGKRHWYRKFSYRYFVIAIKRWFAKKVLNILKGLL